MWRQIRVYPSCTPLDSLRSGNIFAYQREATINTSRPRSRRDLKRAVINIQSPNFPVSELLRLNPYIRHHNCCKPCHQIGNYKELVNAPSHYKWHITRHCFSNETQRYTDLVMCFKGRSNIIFVQQNLWGQICIHKGFIFRSECRTLIFQLIHCSFLLLWSVSPPLCSSERLLTKSLLFHDNVVHLFWLIKDGISFMAWSQHHMYGTFLKYGFILCPITLKCIIWTNCMFVFVFVFVLLLILWGKSVPRS